MATLIDSQTDTSDSRYSGEQGARLAFENAHRMHKKALISDIRRGLRLRGQDAVSDPIAA